MKRQKRTHALRISFTDTEWRVIESAYEAQFSEGYPNRISASERALFPRQAILAVALGIIKLGRMPLPLAADLRHMEDREFQMKETIATGGNMGWVLGPVGGRFNLRFE